MSRNKKREFTEEQLKIIATRSAMGATQQKIADDLGITQTAVSRILKDTTVKNMVKETIKEITTASALAVRRDSAELGPLAVAVVKAKLLDNDLKAAEMVFKVLGVAAISEEEAKNQQHQAIQLIIPGISPPEKPDVILPNEEIIDAEELSKGI